MIKIVHCISATYVLLAHTRVGLFGAFLAAEQNKRASLFFHISVLYALPPRVALQDRKTKEDNMQVKS